MEAAKEAYYTSAHEAFPVDYAEGYTTDVSASSKQGFWHRVDNFIKLDTARDDVRSNEDLDPVMPDKRDWGYRHYALFWISDHLSVSGFRSAASVMEVGLSWRLALLCIAIANIFQGVFITINGITGAQYKIPFSIQSRAAFGYYLSYLMIAMRCIVAIFWYGIQAYTGAECVQSILYAIFPQFRKVPNGLPESANITTQFMTSYVIYYILCLPLHYVGVHRLKWLFLLKSIATPIACFAIMGWMVQQTGAGNNSLFSQGNTVQGAKLGWAFMGALYSNIGSGVTLMVNAPDYSRYCVRQRSTYATAWAVPFTSTVMTIIGVITAGGSKVLYGTILWDPLLIVNKWTSHGGRAAAFFIAFSFLLSQLGLNIAANSLAAANDMNCMFPRYINIRRGQFIASVLGAWALTPWNILTSAPAFLNFMSGYTVWLGPLCGILISDFFFVHKKKYNVFELYNFNGMYRYYYGFNWRALLAFFIGWVPLLPGFLPTVSNIPAAEGMIHLYQLGFFYGCGSACLSYWVLCYFWPARETYLEHGVYVDDYLNYHPNSEGGSGSILEEENGGIASSLEKKSF
ncbi:permease for cytosine/purines, uracil, thiamine, allantoin-domain-containing protein [Lipomyces oligophaga]|uniref:permease for cytosine/purines, uracil, thiamine, allantoin-domain-containing protein n=1 Tax=Lipomyces oligophaga TaxID=45792 RepID=UPI0034CDCFAC